MTDQKPTVQKFQAAATNTGPMTINGQPMTGGKTVTLKTPDGAPMLAGGLNDGQEFTVDLKTGIVTIKT